MSITHYRGGSVRSALARVTASHLLTAAAALAAFVLVLGLLHDQSRTTEILVAATDLPAGSPLTARSVRGVQLPADIDIDLDELVPADQELVGVAIHREVAVGSPLRRSDLEALEGGPRQQRLSIPVEPERAVGGKLRLLDRVDVISVADGGAELVATGLRVVDLPVVEQGVFGPAGGPWYVTVELDPEEALAVAAAIDVGSVQLARSAERVELGA